MARSRIFPILAAISVLMSAEIGDAGGSGIAGVTVTRPVPSAVESFRDVQARAPGRQAVSPPQDRLIPFRNITRPMGASTFAPSLSLSLSPAAPLPLAPVSLAPALDLNFEGLANPTAGDVIPPDTMGAVGPNHLVSLLNSQFGVFDKLTGLPIGAPVTLQGFWTGGTIGAGAGQPANSPFDPKILYDTNSGRFVAATLGGDVAIPSWLMVAISATSDPTGNWIKVAIRADLDNNVQQSFNSADYTCLGVDASNIYVTANMFDNTSSFQYSKVWVIPKNQPALTVGSGTLSWTEFLNPAGLNTHERINAFAMQPALTFGTATAEYFIFEDGSDFLRLASITSSAGTPTWNNLGSIQVTPFTSLSATPDAPQQGDTRGINTSDTRLLKAVFRNGSVWTVHHVSGTGGKTEVAWYQVNPATLGVVQQGRISDPARWYYYPSIAVNQSNDVAIGFSGSSPTEFVGGWYTARKGGDPVNTMQPPSLLKAGESSYFKTLGGAENRWGDFSATAVDPADDLTFWTLQEYAESPVIVNGSLRSMWGTWWGKFRASAIAAPVLTATVVSATRVDLSWTLPGGATGFRVERRQLPGGIFGAITADLGPAVTSYTDNTITGGVTYSYRIHASSAAGDSFSNEATAVMPSPSAPSGGGGGGGCSVSNGNGQADPFSSGVIMILLFLPAGALAARRRINRRRRGASGTPSPARQGAP
jgi:hypothetical protein